MISFYLSFVLFLKKIFGKHWLKLPATVFRGIFHRKVFFCNSACSKPFVRSIFSRRIVIKIELNFCVYVLSCHQRSSPRKLWWTLQLLMANWHIVSKPGYFDVILLITTGIQLEIRLFFDKKIYHVIHISFFYIKRLKNSNESQMNFLGVLKYRELLCQYCSQIV